MAQQFTTQDGVTLIDPGTYVSVTVQPNQGNTAAAGVVTLIGEADEGPGFQDEADLESVNYDPSQMGKIQQKYQSGKLVDAARACISAANDSAIQGAVSLIRLIKTNRSLPSMATTSRSGFGAYAQFTALRRGSPGNGIKYRSEIAAAETAPTTGSFDYVPLITGSASFDLRTNGGSKKSISVAAKDSPSFLKSLIEDFDLGLMPKGGIEKLVSPTAALTLVATAPTATTLLVTLQTGNQWVSAPVVGDVAVIPANTDYSASQDSTIAGGALQNVASYIVTGVTNSLTSATLSLKRISAGSCIAASGTVSADKTDIILFSSMEIKNVTGQERGSLVGVDGTYTCTLNDGTNVSISLPSGKVFAAQPKAGDILVNQATFAGVTAGFYQVVSSTASTVTCYRLSDGTSGVTGSAVVTGPVTLLNQPFSVQAPVIDGVGKTLTVEGTVSSIFLKASDGSDAGLSNIQKLSASEYKNVTTFSKGTQSQALTSGGEIVLTMGCTEEDATVTISGTQAEFSVSGNLRFTVLFSDFKTLKDMADFISSQQNFSAAVPLAKQTVISPAQLDESTYTISGIASHKNGRIKRDATVYSATVNGSAYVSCFLNTMAGLPEVVSPDQFLTGGAKAGSLASDFTSAIDAMEMIDTNFIVPLISVDSLTDIGLGETESASTYTIDGINAYLKSHILKMSAIEMRKNRSALCSKRDTYENCKTAASEIAAYRVGLAFQDAKNFSVAANGIKQFQPWMSAVIAAGMQAAAGYKGIVKKGANVSGIITPFGDFNPSNPGDRKDALKAGLLFMEKIPTGGFRWASDQTTYSIDNNFVYNSLQAVYVSDLVTLSLIQTFDRLVVGKSVAEISAAAALTILEGEMFNYKRLRWIAASDDAPKGFKNPNAKLSGPVLEISCEIKLAGLIYFVPIYLAVSQVEQTAVG